MAIEITSGDILTHSNCQTYENICWTWSRKTHFLVENIKNIVKTVPKVTNSQNRKVYVLHIQIQQLKKSSVDFMGLMQLKLIQYMVSLQNILCAFSGRFEANNKEGF